jgi:hypothetical protein
MKAAHPQTASLSATIASKRAGRLETHPRVGERTFRGCLGWKMLGVKLSTVKLKSISQVVEEKDIIGRNIV